jgi:hypothetical protein
MRFSIADLLLTAFSHSQILDALPAIPEMTTWTNYNNGIAFFTNFDGFMLNDRRAVAASEPWLRWLPARLAVPTS